MSGQGRGAPMQDARVQRTAFGLDQIWADGATVGRLGRWAMARQLGVLAWRSVVSAPLTAVLTLGTISTALFLLALFCFAFENLERITSEMRSEVALTMYFKSGTAPTERSEFERMVRGLPEVASVAYTSEAEALAMFGRSLGNDAALLEGLAERNPLPASLDVRFRPESGSNDVYSAFAAQYGGHPLVERIHYSSGVVGHLGVIARAVRWGGGVAVICLLLATGFLMANTIKLAMYAHRNEIEIMRLVGATQAFVRAPFIIEGTVHGLLGALIGLGALAGVLALAGHFLAESELVALVPGMTPYVSSGGATLVLVAGGVVGFVGSLLAVRRFSIE
jgi:cell division transport system permease protein